MKKNVASQIIGAQLVSKTDGSAVTTGTTTVYVTGDGGTQAAGSVGSGACTHEGNGFWTYAPAQAETNYDHIAFTFVNTNAVNATVQVFPSFPQTGDNFARLGAPAGASVSADVAAIKTQTAAIETDTQDIQTRLPAALVSGRMDASVGAMASNVMTAAAAASDLTTELQSGLATAAALTTVEGKIDTIDGIVDSILVDTAEIGAAGAGLTVLATQASVNTIDDFLDTEVAAIKAKTDNLPTDPADASDISGAFSTVNSTLSTIAGYLDTEIAAIKAKTDNLPAAPAATGDIPSAATIADAVWDEAASGHVTAGTFGQAQNLIRSNTAQAGASTTITLDASASAVNDFYNGTILAITAGTGAGQARIIEDYVGATKVATVAAWATNPSSDSVFVIVPFGSIPGASAPTAAQVADAVWDEALSGHLGTGSTGEALNAAGAAGDPWTTSLPGAYGAGSAGYIIGNNIDAAISSRASQTSVNTVDDFLDTEIAAIKAKTDNLPADPADASDIAGAFSTVNGTLSTIAGYLDTEIAAIKAKTDNLPADPADASDIAAAFAVTNGKIDVVDDFLDTEIAAIKAKTDLIPASPATEGTLTTIAGYLDTEVAAIKAKTDNLPADPADASDVAALIAAVSAKVDTVDDFLDTEVAAIKAKTDLIPGTQDGYSFAQLQLLMASVLLGKASGLETTSAIYRALDDSKDRVTATVDADGNRSAVARDAS